MHLYVPGFRKIPCKRWTSSSISSPDRSQALTGLLRIQSSAVCRACVPKQATAHGTEKTAKFEGTARRYKLSGSDDGQRHNAITCVFIRDAKIKQSCYARIVFGLRVAPDQVHWPSPKGSCTLTLPESHVRGHWACELSSLLFASVGTISELLNRVLVLEI